MMHDTSNHIRLSVVTKEWDYDVRAEPAAVQLRGLPGPPQGAAFIAVFRESFTTLRRLAVPDYGLITEVTHLTESKFSNLQSLVHSSMPSILPGRHNESMILTVGLTRVYDYH